MKRPWRILVTSVAVTAGLSLALAGADLEAQQKSPLVSKKVAAAPALDGSLDAAWKTAVPLTVKVVGGKNLPGGTTDVTIRSVYAGDSVYFMYQYKDATQSFQRSPWQKQADGSWKKLKDASDKGGDNNQRSEERRVGKESRDRRERGRKKKERENEK